MALQHQKREYKGKRKEEVGRGEEVY